MISTPIYSRGNAAKQWIFEELDASFGDAPFTIVDYCCGTGGLWRSFLEAHPHATYRGLDYDRAAIERGQREYADMADRVTISAGDAQSQVLSDAADVVTAFSAIEHVVDRPAFLKTVFASLRPGGVAYPNYDVGHFRSRNVKERIMVPVSQALAWIGIQGPYMKRVDDNVFKGQAEEAGFAVLDIRKHNMASLKGFMRGANDESIRTWYDFEKRMGELYPPNELDRLFLSTTLKLKKP